MYWYTILIEISKNFTLAVLDGAAQGLGSVDFNGVYAASEVWNPDSNNLGNSYYLCGNYFAEINKVCAKHVLAEFGCKLDAVDTTIMSHCNEAQSFWRIDY